MFPYFTKSLLTVLISLMMSTLSLYDFTKTSDLGGWYVVNDGVMGGLSKGMLELDEDGHGVFHGVVSLENNGGFSSIRYAFPSIKTSDYTHIVLRIRGDGKRYQFRVKPEITQYFSFITYFETQGEWETIRIPLKEMYPVFRGNRLELPNYDGKMLQEIGILIGNKQAETFRLEMDSIYLEARE